MPYRNRMNEPAMTRYTLEFIAEKREISSEELAEITRKNTERVLKINE